MKPWHWALIALAVAGAAYTVGRYTASGVVTERTVTDTRAAERVRELTAELSTLKRHTRREEITRPDGTRTVVTDTHVDRVVDTRTTVDTKRDVYTHKDTTKTAERRWVAGPMLVVVPSLKPLGAEFYVGGMVSYRVVGPFSVGLSATVPTRQPISVPTLGLTLTAAF